MRTSYRPGDTAGYKPPPYTTRERPRVVELAPVGTSPRPKYGMRSPAISLVLLLALPSRGALGDEWIRLAEHADAAERVANPSTLVLAQSEPLLRSGWSVAEPWPGQAHRAIWADAPETILEVPLARPRPLRVTLHVTPLNCAECPGQTARVTVNGTEVASLELPPGDFRDVSFDVPAAAWRYRDNEIAMTWGRLVSPREHDPGSRDARRLAASLTTVRFDPAPGHAPALPTQEGSALLVPGDEALAFTLRIPADGTVRLSGRVARDVRSSIGAAGIARISVRTDGTEERELAVRSLSGLTTSPRSLDVELPELAGEIVRLSLRVDAAAPGLVTRWEELALSVEGGGAPLPSPADALGEYEPRLPSVEETTSGAAGASVLIYLMDALRARDLGCYGELAVTSPFLDRLSRSGVLLARNVSQAPNTPPSVKALLTGRYLPHTGNQPLAAADVTLPRMLRDVGYRTVALCNSPWPGAVGALEGVENAPRYDLCDPTSDAALYYRDGLLEKPFGRMLSERLVAFWHAAPAAPFVAYLHAIHPHNPYAPPGPWAELAGERADGSTEALLAAQHGARTIAPAELAALHRLYQHDILANDHAIAWLAAHARALGIWPRTAFALVSDHGEEMGEHGGILHGWTGYSEMIETPVLLHAPGLPPGAIVDSLTETIDVAPTLAAIAGAPRASTFDGASLVPLLQGAEGPRPRAYSSASSVPGIFTVVDRDLKYVFAPRNGHEVGIGEGSARVRERFFLHDLAADPMERTNLVRTHPITARYLHRSLLSWLDATGGDAIADGASCAGCTEEQRAVFQALGYVGE